MSSEGPLGRASWRKVLRPLAALLALTGAICLVVPVAQFLSSTGAALWPDTFAYFGAGTADGVPEVSDVRCGYVRTSRTSSLWRCRLSLVQAGSTMVLQRELEDDRTGDRPRLRRLSGAGEQASYGVVWSGGELAWRWFSWALSAAGLWFTGVLLLVGARLAWVAGRARLLAGVLACVWAGSALAQEAAGWPGEWQVLRVEMPGGAGPGSFVPGCMLTTSNQAARPSDPTRWSLRYRRGDLALIENSIGVGDATIPGLALTVDGRAFGMFPIRERVSSPEHTPSVVKYVSAIAPVQDGAAREGIVAALRPGSMIRIERRGRTFEAALDGRAGAAFEACRQAVDG